MSDATHRADGLRRSRVVRRPGRGVHRPRLRVRRRGLQRRRTRRPGADSPGPAVRSTTTTPSRAASGYACTRSSSACSPAACRSTRVGHQFHLSLSTPVISAGGRDRRVRRPAGDAGRQRARRHDRHAGDRSACSSTRATSTATPSACFREHADELFSVTVWGLTDGRSWRVGAGAPLVFDDELQAKPAYYGTVDGELPPRQRSAFVFRPRRDLGIDAAEWDAAAAARDRRQPARFQLRWAHATRSTAYVRVVGRHVDAADGSRFVVGGHDLRRPAQRRRRRRRGGRGADRRLGRAVAELPADRRPRSASSCVRRPGHRRRRPPSAGTSRARSARSRSSSALSYTGGGRGRRGAGDRRRDRRRLVARRTRSRPTSQVQGTARRDGRRADALARQHAVRPRRGHRRRRPT